MTNPCSITWVLYKLTNYLKYVFVCSYLVTYVLRLPSHPRLIYHMSNLKIQTCFYTFSCHYVISNNI